jgi:hypothetical protein
MEEFWRAMARFLYSVDAFFVASSGFVFRLAGLLYRVALVYLGGVHDLLLTCTSRSSILNIVGFS